MLQASSKISMLSAHNIAEVNAGEPVELPDMVLCGVDKSGDLH